MNVQDRYQYRRSFVENIIERPFLDVAQTNIANIDIHISFMDISSTSSSLELYRTSLGSVLQDVRHIYTDHIRSNDLCLLQKTDKNLNTVVASKLTIRQLRMQLNKNCATETGVYANDRNCTGPYKKKYRLTSFSGSSGPDTTSLNCT